MIRKSLVLLVAALLIAGPSFATTGTVGGAGAGAGAGHSGGGSSGGGGHAGSSAGNAGSGHVVGGHVGSSLSGPHAHSAAHAVSARAVSAAHHGPGHHHAGYNLAFNKDDTFNQGKGLWGGCGPLAPSVAENRVVCTGLTKMQIDPTTGAPAP